MDSKIGQIISKALDGGEITAPELRALLSVHYLSGEAYAIQYASRKISAAASDGRAEVHAQVGIDVGPCTKNCQFCSFAAVNKVFSRPKVHDLEEIIRQCLQFEADGANAIYLMITADFPFADYLKIAREVRAALKPATPMISNTGDFDDDGARALAEAGFVGVYHVVRMGEGVVSAIKPATRLQTIEAARRAGLLVGTCVEPVGPEHSVDELADKAMLARRMHPVHCGSGRRIHIPGSPLEAHGTLNEGQITHIMASVKLAMGYGITGHCSGNTELTAMAGTNLSWAEACANPRDTKERTVRGGTVKKRQAAFREAGWDIVDGPSRIFGSK
jgi:biotin synthase